MQRKTSLSKKGETPPTKEGELYVGCAFNPKGLDEETCEHYSSIPAHAEKCQGCKCPWRNTETVPEANPHGGMPSYVELDRGFYP